VVNKTYIGHSGQALGVVVHGNFDIATNLF